MIAGGKRKRGIDVKVILKQDVKSLGAKGSIVEVSDGYARNFLLPKGLAVEATESNLNEIRIKRQAEEKRKEKETAYWREIGKKLNSATVVIKARSGEGSKLFGSVTNKDIADRLKADLGLDIDKKVILLPEPIKSLGAYTVEVRPYPEISAKLTVKIEKE